MSCRSLTEPFEILKMRSMIEDAYPDESFTQPKFDVPTVLPEKTFLEKIFLLHEEFNRAGGGIKMDRLTRHLYDIEKMMDEYFAIEVINNIDLYTEIVEYRSKYTAWSGLNYKTHHPSTISFLPPETLTQILRDDYRKMQEGFIYKDSLTYDELIGRLKVLQDRFRSLGWDSPFFQESK